MVFPIDGQSVLASFDRESDANSTRNELMLLTDVRYGVRTTTSIIILFFAVVPISDVGPKPNPGGTEYRW